MFSSTRNHHTVFQSDYYFAFPPATNERLFFKTLFLRYSLQDSFLPKGKGYFYTAQWKLKRNVPPFENLFSPSRSVHGQAPWNSPILKEKLFGEPGSVTAHDLTYAQVFKNKEGSSIIKSIKQSSEPKEAVEEKKNRV